MPIVAIAAISLAHTNQIGGYNVKNHCIQNFNLGHPKQQQTPKILHCNIEIAIINWEHPSVSEICGKMLVIIGARRQVAELCWTDDNTGSVIYAGSQYISPEWNMLTVVERGSRINAYRHFKYLNLFIIFSKQ